MGNPVTEHENRQMGGCGTPNSELPRIGDQGYLSIKVSETAQLSKLPDSSSRVLVQPTPELKREPGGALLRSLQSVLNATVLVFALLLCLPITYGWVALIVGLVVWVAVLALRTKCGEQVFRVPPLAQPLAIYAAAVCLSGVVNDGLRELLPSFFSLRPFIAYFWAYDAFSRNERLKLLSISTLLSITSLAGLWGAIQQIFDIHPFGFKFLQGTGFLSAPMAYAGQMQLFALLSMGIYFTRAFKRLPGPFSNKRLFMAITGANILGVIFASERSAWLGFACGAIVVGLACSWRLAMKVSGAAVVSGVVAWYTLPVFKKRLLPLLDPQHDVGTRARLMIWERAWGIFKQHPTFGVGIRKFPHINIPEALVPGQAQYLSHAHSNYLHVLATTGIVGFFAYLWLTFATLSLSLQQFLRNRIELGALKPTSQGAFQSAIGLGLFAGLVSLAVSGAFEYNFGTSHVRLAQWFLLGLLVAPRR